MLRIDYNTYTHARAKNTITRWDTKWKSIWSNASMAVAQHFLSSSLFWQQQCIRWIIKSNAQSCKSKCRLLFCTFYMFCWYIPHIWKSTGCNEPWTKNETYVDILSECFFTLLILSFVFIDIKFEFFLKKENWKSFLAFFLVNSCSRWSVQKLFISIFLLFYTK